jgi:transposase
MPRGTVLSKEERGQVIAHVTHGMSERAIAKAIGRSRSVVHAFLLDPEGYNTIKRPGRPKMLTPAAERLLLRTASKGKLSSRELKQELKLPLSARRIRDVLAACPTLSYVKRMPTPTLTQLHKQNRLTWARGKVTWDATKWNLCVFSDEKKFNLDGPDGFQFYWHDLRFEKELFSKRQSGGGSVMVWGAFCAQGKSELVFLEGKQDSQAYIWTLSEHLLPFIDLKYGRDCIFQQDNASIHSSRATKDFFVEENVEVMDWPAKSPDLNPIENMWGMLARAVYAQGRQFQTRNDLIVTIKRSWDKIGQDLINSLLESMPKRCVSVLELRGMKTKY